MKMNNLPFVTSAKRLKYIPRPEAKICASTIATGIHSLSGGG